MSDQRERIQLTSADGEVLEFYVVEQTRINNINYLLVEDAAREGEAYILKETVGDAKAQESVFEFVEDDSEFEALAKVFEALLDEEDIELE
ncbi:MAG TPA: DUF1292 domain-containing protein [Candidatus Scybalocola faecipullorum]|nr:DUF1292 domain-containing protein [Candidatus Scybalocola faecipullorum]